MYWSHCTSQHNLPQIIFVILWQYKGFQRSQQQALDKKTVTITLEKRYQTFVLNGKLHELYLSTSHLKQLLKKKEHNMTYKK